jgi:DMSO/TMAO reductase YedYZ molybdopterin-dependent catalytic subunit
MADEKDPKAERQVDSKEERVVDAKEERVVDPKEERIVDARLKLRERFLDKMRSTPAASDSAPQGNGPPNRHGMPRLPVGQTLTKGWPVLDLGRQPNVPLHKWELIVDGAVEEPLKLAWKDFVALPQTKDVSDFHCVTTWSKLDVPWEGVQLSTLLALARPHAGATHLSCTAYDGYTTNLPLEEALKEDVLLVHTAEGKPLPVEHGGPVRVITPQLYAWKGAKWIHRIELLTRDRLGYWELRGYSNTAHPWRNDRYS